MKGDFFASCSLWKSSSYPCARGHGAGRHHRAAAAAAPLPCTPNGSGSVPGLSELGRVGLRHRRAQEGIGVRFWHNKERIVLCPARLLQGFSGRRWNFAFPKVVLGEFSCNCSSCSCSWGLALRNVLGKTSVPCSQPLPTSQGGTGEPELEFLRQPPLHNIFRPSSHLIPTSSLIRATNITKPRVEITFDLKLFLIILHLA